MDLFSALFALRCRQQTYAYANIDAVMPPLLQLLQSSDRAEDLREFDIDHRAANA